MALHLGESGSFKHCLAGIDIALWDLVVRREGRSLFALLRTEPPSRVKTYASTLNAAWASELAQELHDSGHRAFKLKASLDLEGDRKLVQSDRNAIGEEPKILV